MRAFPLAAASLALALAAAPIAAKDDPFAGDCAFLLEELPKRAEARAQSITVETT